VDVIREKRDGRTVMKVQGTISIYEISALHRQMLECFKECNDFIIDLGEVSDCDTAGAQLLCAARATVGPKGKSPTIDGISKGVGRTLNRLGINPARIREQAKEEK